MRKIDAEYFKSDILNSNCLNDNLETKVKEWFGKGAKYHVLKECDNYTYIQFICWHGSDISLARLLKIGYGMGISVDYTLSLDDCDGRIDFDDICLFIGKISEFLF